MTAILEYYNYLTALLEYLTKNYSPEQALLLHDKHYLQGEGSCFMKDPMISVYLRFEVM